jgi:hypothetical protein
MTVKCWQYVLKLVSQYVLLNGISKCYYVAETDENIQYTINSSQLSEECSRMLQYNIIGYHQCGFQLNRSTTDTFFFNLSDNEKENGSPMRQYINYSQTSR